MELPKLQDTRVTLSNKLVKWLLFLKGVQKQELWEEISMNEPLLVKAMDTLEFLSQNEEARRLYELRQKALHDEASMIAGAKEEGLREGLKEGKKEMVLKLLQRGMNVAEIIEISGLPEDEIRRLQATIH
jgi:predicted transposase/invertase (TIGR01784 family)